MNRSIFCRNSRKFMKKLNFCKRIVVVNRRISFLFERMRVNNSNSVLYVNVEKQRNVADVRYKEYGQQPFKQMSPCLFHNLSLLHHRLTAYKGRIKYRDVQIIIIIRTNNRFLFKFFIFLYRKKNIQKQNSIATAK